MCISGIYAITDEISNIENGISTSSVDISLKEYNQDDEIFQDDGKYVVPGDEITLIPRAHNLGIDCYIRTKITYTIAGDKLEEIDFIKGNYSSWIKSEDYYYYDTVLGKEDSIDLFNKILIPSNLSGEYNGKKVSIRINVDAIQARNFDGNWNEVTIQKSVDRTYDIDYSGASSVIFENDTNNHVTVGDSFFNNLGNMLPGDCISENIKIKNDSSNKNRYYMAIHYDELNQNEIDLLKEIKLSVRNSNNHILVDNNLAFKGKQNLGDLNTKEEDSYIIELNFPKSIGNDYSKLFTKIIWEFSYEPLEESNNYNSISNVENPNTGDFKRDWPITVFLLSALGFIVTSVLDKINKKNMEVREL